MRRGRRARACAYTTRSRAQHRKSTHEASRFVWISQQANTMHHSKRRVADGGCTTDAVGPGFERLHLTAGGNRAKGQQRLSVRRSSRGHLHTIQIGTSTRRCEEYSERTGFSCRRGRPQCC